MTIEIEKSYLPEKNKKEPLLRKAIRALTAITLATLLAREKLGTTPQEKVIYANEHYNDLFIPYWDSVPGTIATSERLTSGSLPIATILCKFSGTTEPYPKSAYEAFLDTANQYWINMSYGNANLEGSRVFGWFEIGPRQTDLQRLIDECTAAADLEVDFRDFEGLNLIFSGGIGYSGVGIYSYEALLDGEVRTWGVSMISGPLSLSLDLVTHEEGHALFNMEHVAGPDWTFAYGDIYSNMSYHLAQGIDVYNRSKPEAGFIPQERIMEVSPGQESTLTIDSLTNPKTTSDPLMVKAIISESHYITIERREKSGYDQYLPKSGIVAHEYDSQRPIRVRVVDPTNHPLGYNAALAPGQRIVVENITVCTLFTGEVYVGNGVDNCPLIFLFFPIVQR